MSRMLANMIGADVQLQMDNLAKLIVSQEILLKEMMNWIERNQTSSSDDSEKYFKKVVRDFGNYTNDINELSLKIAYKFKEVFREHEWGNR